MALKVGDYKTDVHNDWCPGCGDFGIVNSIQMALAEMEIPRHETAIFSGIGCSGKTSHFINVFGVHTLHGRVLPFAQGAKISNPNLKIIAVGGDGDGLGIGAGHFVAAGRRNVDMTYIIFDNAVYGLTKGQASPTLKLGEKTKSLPTPNTNYNVNPIGLAIASGFTFAARAYSYDIRHLNGVDRVDETTNKPMPRIYKLEDTDYDPVVHYSDETELNQKKTQAIVKSLEWDTKIPTGIFYKNELITPYTRRLIDKIPNYIENPSALQNISKNNAPITKINHILDSYKV